MASLLEFKAGQVDFDNETGNAVPLAGQGRVVLKHSSEDPSFLGLQWFPRAKNRGSSGEELLLLPGDVEFTHSPECNTGRVVQMQFQSSGERHFFWLQDAPKGDLHELSEEDAGIISKLNELVNEYDPGEEAADDSMQVDESTPLTKEEESKGPSKADENEQVSNLQSALRSALARNIGQSQNTQTRPQLPLSKKIDTSARISHVLSASDDQLARLLAHTPEVASNREELLEVIQSPHFTSALDSLGQAVLESPALAQEIGLSRQPVSIDDFLQLFREAVGNSRPSNSDGTPTK